MAEEFKANDPEAVSRHMEAGEASIKDTANRLGDIDYEVKGAQEVTARMVREPWIRPRSLPKLQAVAESAARAAQDAVRQAEKVTEAADNQAKGQRPRL